MQQYLPFTVLKLKMPTAYPAQHSKLQQYLPFTVLKLINVVSSVMTPLLLQQYLPFTVLKRITVRLISKVVLVATVLTVYGIETLVRLLN